MDILVLGLSHHTAPLEVRERLHFSENAVSHALQRLLQVEDIQEGVILSTCNRVELYAHSRRPERSLPALDGFFETFHSVPRDLYHPFLYRHERDEAARHLFRVTASLDSLVVGEPQIVGQVKEAFRKAIEEKAAGPGLQALLERALRVAKRVRNETAVSEAAVSVSYAAVELAERIFGSLDEQRVLLVGASEMGELAARHLLSRGVRKVLVANRSHEKAVELARGYEGSAIPFSRLADHLADVDVVITSTSAPGFIIGRDTLAKAMRRRRHRPMFLVDIAVPRDIDPVVRRIDNVYLYNIDDLQQVVEENLASRRAEADKAEAIVDNEVRDFAHWLRRREVAPTIRALRSKAEGFREAELERIASRLEDADPAVREAVEEATRRLVNKLLHDPLRGIRRSLREQDAMARLERIRDLFGLDRDEDGG